MEEAEYFRSKAENIKDALKEANLADVTEVDLFVAMEEEGTICLVDKMLEWCNTMMDHNWRLIHHMTSLTSNGTGYLRKKE